MLEACACICFPTLIRADLLVLAYTLASLKFVSEVDKKMLKRRFAMVGDILRDTWAYQEIMEEGREEGREEGLQALRRILMSVIQNSFSELVLVAKEKADLINDPVVLQDMTLKLLATRSIEEARQLLDAVVIEPKSVEK